MLLKAIKNLFIRKKDYAGRDIDDVIRRLAAQTDSNAEAWSYLEREHVYENTTNRMKVYPHEVVRWH